MAKVVASFKDRLNEALDIRNMRPIDLCNRADIPESAMSQYRSGYAMPRRERMVRIADSLNVSLMWLMGADVPMEKQHSIPNFNPLNVPIRPYDPEAEKRVDAFFDKIGSLNKDRKKQLMDFLDFLYEQEMKEREQNGNQETSK